jgi:methionyl-tRNA formyltransferase
MKIAILSTPSKHHTYFINRLHRRFEICALVYERRRLRKEYATGPFFDAEEDRFEDRFFEPSQDGVEPVVPADVLRRLIEVHSVNQAGVAAYLKALAPEVLVLFGTGRAEREVLMTAGWGAINVHRGLTQYYRGLDSDLWAIGENRFDRIGVTIHYADEDFDTGPILAQERLSLGADDEIFHIRYKTSIMATRMVEDVLGRMQREGGRITGEPLTSPGPYYSAMSVEEKWRAFEKFKAHQLELRAQHVD